MRKNVGFTILLVLLMIPSLAFTQDNEEQIIPKTNNAIDGLGSSYPSCSSTESMEVKHARGDDFVIYITDDNNNHYKQIISPNGDDRLVLISEDEMMAYMNETSDLKIPSDHSWTEKWLPNESWCYRNCMNCGAHETQEHVINVFAGDTQNNAICTSCGYPT